MKNKIIQIKNSPIFGWKFLERNGAIFWYKGYIYNSTFKDIFSFLEKIEFKEINNFVHELDGNFSFIFKNEVFTFATVDKISSIPLFYYEQNEKLIITPHVFLIKDIMNTEDIVSESVLSISMSGYTIGNNTLIKKLKKINCGEFFYYKHDNKNYHLINFYNYLPTNLELDENIESYKKIYIDKTIKVFQKLHQHSLSINKNIAISMSAGLDTRLIVSALKNIGAKNLIGFSYGLKNNSEANAAKELCKYLDIPWKFSEFTNSKLNKIIKSKDFIEFRDKTDTYYSSSDYSDYFAIKELVENSFLENSIVVNGHSGDFIAGGHMLNEFYINDEKKDYLTNAALAIIKKHFRLWNDLANFKNDSIVEKLLIERMKLLNVNIKNNNQIFGIIENIQLQERQSKHCLSRQRNYENFNLDWALPLWDSEYLDFWEKIPFELKLNRAFYKNTMFDKNFCKVWSGKKWEKLNIDRKIKPWFLKILRYFVQIFFLFSKKKWKIFDKKYFLYWIDICCGYSLVNYRRLVVSKRNFRGPMSWQARAYLKKKDL